MSWLDRLRPASYRGVPFFVERIALATGRRGADHEYPGRDEPYAEDLGRRQRTIEVEAILLEPEHIAAAQRLQAACEEPGAGTLVHPWLGEMQVACRSLSVRFAVQPSAVAILAITFVEAGAYRQATRSRADFRGSARDAASTVRAAAKRDFTSRFKAQDWLDAVSGDASALLREWTGVAKGQLGAAAAAGAQLAAWSRQAASLSSMAGTAVRDPSLLVDDVASVVGLSWADYAGGFRALTRLARWRTAQAGEPWLRSPSAVAIGGNRQAFEALVGSLAVAAAVDALADPAVAFHSADEVSRDVAAWEVAVDGLLPLAADDGYRALTLLRARVRQLGQMLAGTLPRVQRITNAATQPALLVAQAVYGDRPADVAAGAASVVTANAIRHPLFVPVGAVEVLVGDR